HRVMQFGGKAIVKNYTPTKAPVNAFKAAVQASYAAAFPGAPPANGPVELIVMFVLPRPKYLIWKTKPMPRLWHTAKPDLDNLEKALKDALTGLAWRDDCQVCDKISRKRVAAGDEQPHVFVSITELEGR